MFSPEEILEDFAEAQTRGRQGPWSHDLKLHWFGREPEDDATRFLESTEEDRTYMREAMKTAHIKPSEVPEVKPPVRAPYDVHNPPRQTLTKRDVIQIRELVGRGLISGREAAKRYGVSHVTIQRIMQNKTYKQGRILNGKGHGPW